ncbi:MAG TPA: hypothetical protein VF815_02320 [Myxococcaceae bacterium]|jgi:hypothetical protein
MVNWQSLLDGSVAASGIAVKGVCLGDGLNTLPLKEITEVTPRLAQDSEPRGMVTRESPLEEVRKHGGDIHAGPVTYEVSQGRVRRILVRGNLLSPLPFKTEGDIERLLGPPSGVERKPDSVVYHYPERGFSVGWHPKEGRLEHFAIGVTA